MNHITQWFNKPTAPYGLGIFRILFGALLLWDLLRINRIGLIDSFYPRGIVFPYDIQLPLVEEQTMKMILFGLIASAILILLGVVYRFAMLFFAIFFSYFFFLDQTLYNNHLYLICLISWMMVFMPADAALSLSKKRHTPHIPQWSIRLLQVQLVGVYFFGAISKMNPYWLDMQPVEEILQIRAQSSGRSFLTSDAVQYFVAYGGLVFDLFIGFLLWIKKTRKIAIIATVLFSITNAYLFSDIYIFPFFMIGANILFVDQEWLKDTLGKTKKVFPEGIKEARKLKSFGVAIISVYILIQLILPFRHFFIPGYVDWTGDAQRFSWRMKIQHRKIEEVKFSVWDLSKKQIYEEEVNQHLYPDEIQHMVEHPHMIVQFAQYLDKVYEEKYHIKDCMVKAKVKVQFNGELPTYIFDPELDLLEESKKHTQYHEWVNEIAMK